MKRPRLLIEQWRPAARTFHECVTMAISTAISGRVMEKRVSIAEAKDHFSEIVRSAERSAVVVVTRRGKPVVRVVSEADYGKLVARRKKVDWGEALVDTRGFRFNREEANER